MSPQLRNLLTAKLAAAPGTEVVLSHVVLPPETSLPKHYHPGEEFAYVVAGSVELWDEEEGVRTFEVDASLAVPFKRVHAIKTGPQGATLVVFRVHQEGEPERVLVPASAP